MPDNYTRLSDTISAKEGTAYITIDGQNRPMFEISKLDANLEFSVQEKQLLGHRMKQHKVTGSSGTGSMTMYFMNSAMLSAAVKYKDSGAFTGFTLQVKNEDPQSTIGKQEVALYNVIPKKLPLAHLDDGSDDPITVDTDFTFDDFATLSTFGLPSNYR